MEVLEISNSSAIAKVYFDESENQVGVAYTYKPELFYVFNCDVLEEVKNQIKGADSVGKLIASFKKDGTLQSI